MRYLTLAIFILIGYKAPPPSRFKRVYPLISYTHLGPLSIKLQVWLHKRGVFIHNPIRDECTPGFECCSPECRQITIARRLMKSLDKQARSHKPNDGLTDKQREFSEKTGIPARDVSEITKHYGSNPS